MPIAETFQLDGVVVVDATRGPRRVFVQRIRDEIRYSAYSSYSAALAGEAWDDERGILPSVANAVAYLREYLVGGKSFGACTVPRVVLAGNEADATH